MQNKEPEVGFEGSSRPLLVGLLGIQIFLGYEWLVSGLSKVLSGTFVAGLADELTGKSASLTGWYRSFLEGIVIPNGELFGYVVMAGELALGIALIAAAVIWLGRWSRLSLFSRQLVLGLIVLAGAASILLNINLHLLNGATHPWLIAADPNDEGIDFDSVMPTIQLMISAVAFTVLRRVRAARPAVWSERNAGVGQRPVPGLNG
jgi:thiosulfate dehydrogenase [quinone] large subunit